MGTYFYVVLAFLVGVLVGWFIWGRLRGELDSLRGDLGRTRGERDKLQAASERLTGELDASGKARADLERRLGETTPAAGSGAEDKAPAPLLATPAKSTSVRSVPAVAKATMAGSVPAKAAPARAPAVKASPAKVPSVKADPEKATAARSAAPKPAAPKPAASKRADATSPAAGSAAAKTRATPKAAVMKAAPATPDAPASKPDNLRRLIGIGPVNERLLKAQGVTSFAQIAAWTAADIKRIEDALNFDGRIARERWIEQARLLAAGDEQGFAKQFPTAGTTNNS